MSPPLTRSRSRVLSLAALLTLACSGNAPTTDGPGGDAPTPTTDDPKPETPEPQDPTPEPAEVDLSTDEAVRAAYKEATGKDLHEDDCVGQTGVKGVVVIGGFAHDRGCDVESAFVNGEHIDIQKLKTEGLGMVGWKDVSATDKPAFALLWAEKVLYHWGGDFENESSKAFELKDTPAFAAPEAKADGDDVVVTAWIEEPPGMQDIDVFNLVEIRFSAEGTTTQSNKDRFSVDGSRTR